MLAKLVGLGLLLVCLAWVIPTRAQGCENESQCSFKKPNILLVLDYSSSMTGFERAPAYFPPGQTVTTRWGAELDAASWILRYQQGFFADNARIGLTRFAHDPDLKTTATTIPTDRSFPPITDGFAIDVPFDGSDGEYLQCKGSGVQAAVEVLRGTAPPPVAMSLDPNAIMLTWTRGALRSAHELIDRTRKSHIGESGEDKRDYEVVLMTDGDWTCPDKVGQGCNENPAPEAALLKQAGIPVHVIAFGDATMQPSLNEVALQGGTGKAIDATSPAGIVDAFSSVLDHIRDSVIVPECTSKLPRVLIIMDASSSMIAGSAPGETKWDKARFALSGNPAAPNPGDTGYVEPVLTRKLMIGGRQAAIEDVVHLGMIAFAGASEQKSMVSFGPCMRDNFAWAMDPLTSCDAPGCTNPYAGYPIQWTFKDSDSARMPPFVRSTHSYMPACNQTQGSKSCVGQVPNTFTGQGLRFAQQVIAEYQRNPSPFSIDDRTRFVNVLITDGQTSQGSSSVQAALEAMVAAGIDTYVIGFGTAAELDQAQLQQYAVWGDTKSAIMVDPTQAGGAAMLADALAGVVTGLGLDACCVLNDCAAQPEPQDPNPICGDGRIQGSEVCDDGAANATYGHCGARCDRLHLFCGDGRVDGAEACDDGNTEPGDGCDAVCAREEPADLDAGTAVPPPIVMSSPAHSGASAGQKPAATRKAARNDAGSDAGAATSRQRSAGCGCGVLGGAPRLPAAPPSLALSIAWLSRRRRR